MNRLVVSILFLTFRLYSFSASQTDSLILELNKTIDKRSEYIQEKYDHLKQITKQLSARHISDARAFVLTSEIYNQYKSFIYDSAFNYAIRLQHLAKRMNDPLKIARAKLDLGFVLFSSGLFKEAIDTFKTLKIKDLPDSIKVEYYANLARAYYDIAAYELDNFYSPRYDLIGNQTLDSALNLCSSSSLPFLTLSGLKMMKGQNFNAARPYFERVIKNFKLNYSQYAIATSSMAYIYIRNQQTDKAKEMLIKAAIADIKSSIKETVAIRNLAEILYKQGKVKEAYYYIKIARDEANFYNARQRKNQVASIFPIIEEHELATAEK